MISKHIAHKSGHDSYRALARYIGGLDSEEAGEKILLKYCAGCYAEPEDFESGLEEAVATQGYNTRVKKEKSYHLVVSFRPEDEPKLTPEVFKEIELAFAQALGYGEHQRHVGVHKNTSHLHLHVVYNTIHPTRHTRHDCFQDYAKRDALCRELERKYGLTVDNGRDQARATQGLTDQARTIEAHTGQESFYGYVLRHKDEILAAVATAPTWPEVHQALARWGLRLEPRGAGLVLKNAYGREHAVPSKIDRGLSKSRLEARLGPFEKAAPALLGAVAPKERYQAKPLQKGAERTALYERFQEELAARRSALADIKDEERTAYLAIRQKWAGYRAALKSRPMMRIHRQQLVTEAKLHEQEEVIAHRQAVAAKRQAVREKYPFTSWSGFLRHEAERGSEKALAILRSDPAAPAKSYDEVTRDSLAQQRAILAVDEMPARQRKALVDVTKLQEILAKEALAGDSALTLTAYHVDGRGVVVFQLSNGVTIRDTGRELRFTPGDPATARLAKALAMAKWGRLFRLEADGRAVFDKEAGRKKGPRREEGLSR